MKKSLFSLYDCKGHTYSVPIESANFATAKRMFKVQIQRAGFPLEDFQVVYCGDFDDLTAEFTLSDKVVEPIE